MRKAFDQLRLNLLHYDVVGFRPPQTFFRRIPDRFMDAVLKNMTKIGEALHQTFLKRFLYLEIYVCSKAEGLSFQQGTFSHEHSTPVHWCFCALPYYILWWVDVVFSVLKAGAGKIRHTND